jgi:hypothetical protein
MSPSLKFTLTPTETVATLIGLLELWEGVEQLNAYRASSSRSGMQYWGSWRERGGLLPPNEPYTVATVPEMSDNPGIQGEFYRISPYEIPTIGVTRAAFGIHKDANAATSPGTLGCIFPVTERGWAAIKRDFRTLAKRGISSIPLEVLYLK